MHLRNIGYAILYIAAMRHYELKRRCFNFLPKRKHRLAVSFGTAFFLRSGTLIIVVGMHLAHSGNATMFDEV